MTSDAGGIDGGHVDGNRVEEGGVGACYVYIVPPGQTAFVTAGRFELRRDRRGDAIGRFVYGRSYRDRPEAVELDPVELRLAARTYQTAAMQGVFGALRDAGPDYWGRLVIERHAGIAQLGELDYLLQSPDDRAGALGFGLNVQPPAPRRDFNRTLDLAGLQAIADALIRNEKVAHDAPAGQAAGQIVGQIVGQVAELLLVGTSMGGARPKAVVEDGDGLWLAKFNREDDRWNNARVEHAMLALARRCGLTAAQSRVETAGGRDVLLVQRFDREKAEGGWRRARMVSGLTLLRADESAAAREKWSYVALAEELRRACAAPAQQAQELFRRMCFNALISNIDDHPRNHAIIAWAGDWRLSPAYDLTPSAPVGLERRDLAMACGDLGRFANAANLLSQCGRFLLPRAQAEAVVAAMAATVRGAWYETMRGAGVAARDCELLRGAFVYPGFGRGAG